MKVILRISMLGSAFLALAILFQNCGDVTLSKPNDRALVQPIAGTSYLKIPPNTIDNYRALFVIDMSHSMHQAACDGDGTIDFLIDGVEPLISCDGPTGVDPEGKRYQLLIRWMQDLRQIIDDGKIEAQKLKFLALPFAGVAGIAPHIDLHNQRSILRKMLIDFSISPREFISIEQFEIYIEVLWAIELAYHRKPFHPLIRGAVQDSLRAHNMAAGSSSGTSIPYPVLQEGNLAIDKEIRERLGSQKANFEIVYLSDGVPKPHSKHIEAAVKKIWNSKSRVYDNRYNVGWMDVRAGNRCELRCSEYLSTYVETGAVTLPPLESPTCEDILRDLGNIVGCGRYSDGSNPVTHWSGAIKCEACFRLVRQFDYTVEMSQRPGGTIALNYDRFERQTKYIWGDWKLNRHSRIISELKITENIFNKQYPGHKWRMNFLRIDSEDVRYRTQAGELVKELNWIERAKDYFIKKHRFLVIRSSDAAFDLFSDLSKKNQYKVSMVYAYPRNYRSHATRGWLLDKDIDGLIDEGESPSTINQKRTNGICLDVIAQKYSACISVGCNPNIDADADGLNQCEELTIGTSDYDLDSDGDGIIDEAEILFGFNPTDNDRQIFLSPDRLSNFEHFIRGYSGVVDLRLVPEERQIKIQTDIIDYKQVPNALGYEVWTPGYKIQIKNIPVSVSIPLVKTDLHVVILVQNQDDPADQIWLSKIYEIGTTTENIHVDFNEFLHLDLRGL